MFTDKPTETRYVDDTASGAFLKRLEELDKLESERPLSDFEKREFRILDEWYESFNDYMMAEFEVLSWYELNQGVSYSYNDYRRV